MRKLFSGILALMLAAAGPAHADGEHWQCDANGQCRTILGWNMPLQSVYWINWNNSVSCVVTASVTSVEATAGGDAFTLSPRPGMVKPYQCPTMEVLGATVIATSKRVGTFHLEFVVHYSNGNTSHHSRDFVVTPAR
jgi:hypothetical protein